MSGNDAKTCRDMIYHLFGQWLLRIALIKPPIKITESNDFKTGVRQFKQKRIDQRTETKLDKKTLDQIVSQILLDDHPASIEWFQDDDEVVKACNILLTYQVNEIQHCQPDYILHVRREDLQGDPQWQQLLQHVISRDMLTFPKFENVKRFQKMIEKQKQILQQIVSSLKGQIYLAHQVRILSLEMPASFQSLPLWTAYWKSQFSVRDPSFPLLCEYALVWTGAAIRFFQEHQKVNEQTITSFAKRTSLSSIINYHDEMQKQLDQKQFPVVPYRNQDTNQYIFYQYVPFIIRQWIRMAIRKIKSPTLKMKSLFEHMAENMDGILWTSQVLEVMPDERYDFLRIIRRAIRTGTFHVQFKPPKTDKAWIKMKESASYKQCQHRFAFWLYLVLANSPDLTVAQQKYPLNNMALQIKVVTPLIRRIIEFVIKQDLWIDIYYEAGEYHCPMLRHWPSLLSFILKRYIEERDDKNGQWANSSYSFQGEWVKMIAEMNKSIHATGIDIDPQQMFDNDVFQLDLYTTIGDISNLELPYVQIYLTYHFLQAQYHLTYILDYRKVRPNPADPDQVYFVQPKWTEETITTLERMYYQHPRQFVLLPLAENYSWPKLQHRIIHP